MEAQASQKIDGRYANRFAPRLSAIAVSAEAEAEAVEVEELDCALAKRRALALWVEGLLDS